MTFYDEESNPSVVIRKGFAMDDERLGKVS